MRHPPDDRVRALGVGLRNGIAARACWTQLTKKGPSRTTALVA
jgi:hypothetical protein